MQGDTNYEQCKFAKYRIIAFSILRHIRPRPMPRWPSVANQDGAFWPTVWRPMENRGFNQIKKILRQITPKDKLHQGWKDQQFASGNAETT